MGDVGPLKGTSFALMTFSDNFKLNHKAVHMSIPMITSYLMIAVSFTWQFHVMIFVALSLGKVEYILTFKLVLKLPACV